MSQSSAVSSANEDLSSYGSGGVTRGTCIRAIDAVDGRPDFLAESAAIGIDIPKPTDSGTKPAGVDFFARQIKRIAYEAGFELRAVEALTNPGSAIHPLESAYRGRVLVEQRFSD